MRSVVIFVNITFVMMNSSVYCVCFHLSSAHWVTDALWAETASAGICVGQVVVTAAPVPHGGVVERQTTLDIE